MPLLRTGSSTLSMMNRRATQYQKYLTLASVFLIITSTIVIFCSILLLKFYFLDELYFWHEVFYAAPILMICLGVYMFLVSIYGFAITGTENRFLIGLLAVLMSVAFIGQLSSIFCSWEVRNKITLANVGSAYVVEVLKLYEMDPHVRTSWDRMQQQLRCCGGTNWLTGYNDYRNTPIGGRFSVPDSCCRTESADCGKDLFKLHLEQIRTKIFIDGCLTVLKGLLDNDVVPMMAIYAGVGVVIAVAELIAVVLACAYVAQISRRRHREQVMWNAVRTDDKNDHHMQARAALNQSEETETMC